MGKTPIQAARAAAKKAGQSHDKVREDAKKDAEKVSKLEAKNQTFGQVKGAALQKRSEIHKQRAKDLMDPTTEAGKAYIRQQRKKQKEAEEFLMRTKGIAIKQPVVPEGDDPKDYLCAYFKHGCCAKSAETCKFAHDLTLMYGKRKAADKKDPRDETMDDWEEDQLREVIDQKHGKEKNFNRPTAIVCKFFLEAVEKRQYGWFWKCPDGKQCKYRHTLPQGYLLKTDLEFLRQEERKRGKNAELEKDMEVAAKLDALRRRPAEEKGPLVTPEVFREWKKKKQAERQKKIEDDLAARKKANTLTGRQLVESGQVTNDQDDESGGIHELGDEVRKRKKEEEDEITRIEEEAKKYNEVMRMEFEEELANLEAMQAADDDDDEDDEDDDDDDEDGDEDGEETAVDAGDMEVRDADDDTSAGPTGTGGASSSSSPPPPAPAAVSEAWGAATDQAAAAAAGRSLGDGDDDDDDEDEDDKPKAFVSKREKKKREANADNGMGAGLGTNELGLSVGEERLFSNKAEEKAAKKAAAAARKEAKAAEKAAKAAAEGKEVKAKTSLASKRAAKIAAAQDIEKDSGMPAAASRTVTGVLASRETSRDIKIDSFSMGLNGVELIKDCSIELTIGRRYGLVGQNGCGKTNFLECLAFREVPIPEHMDLYHLKEEAPPSDMNAVESVVDYIKEEIARLEKTEAEILETSGPEDERLQAIYERLESLDPSRFEIDATKLLVGLGFSEKMLAKATKDMSGGWRMRVALARALFIKPTLLLLDEPTNHLDLEACVWLEEYLKNYPHCLLIISHSQDFMNGVCTHMIWLTQQKLKYYTGNYDTFTKTVRDDEVIQQKKHEKEQEDIKHLKAFIASCGTYANMVKQAQSKQKIIDKMMAAGLTPAVSRERSFKFRFPECGKLPPPVIPFVDVSFSYSGKKEDYLYRNLEFGIDCDSRIALVGPNGAGKSTLLKLITGELTPSEGTVNRHPHVRIGKFHQHSIDVLDDTMTPLEFFQSKYPNTASFTREQEQWRAFLGQYGCTGRYQTTKIGTFSEGQKSRLVFGMICMEKPNLLLLDEPTNHLDIEAIDQLAEAIKAYNGGVVLVSHDFRLLEQVADVIWVCDGTVKPWKGDIKSYKQHLIKGMKLQNLHV